MPIELRVARKHDLIEWRELELPTALRAELAFRTGQQAAEQAQARQGLGQLFELGPQVDSGSLRAAVKQ